MQWKSRVAKTSPRITAKNKGRNMANISIVKGRVYKEYGRGFNSIGEEYVSVCVSESIKRQDTGKYDVQYFNCYIHGDLCKEIVVGEDIGIEGSMLPNNYEKNGKRVFRQTIFVKNIIRLDFKKKGKAEKEEGASEKEEAVELPFD